MVHYTNIGYYQYMECKTIHLKRVMKKVTGVPM